jgi:plasmid maintenance system antidote protein VapI
MRHPRGDWINYWVFDKVYSMRGKALTPEQNDHLRGLIRKLLERFTQEELAPMIGLTQSSISSFLTHRGGVSDKVAKKVAAVLGRREEDVLALRDPAEPDRFSHRHTAVQFAQAVGPDEYLPEAIEFVQRMHRDGHDLPVKAWLRMIDFWDEQLRYGHLLPVGPQGSPRR